VGGFVQRTGHPTAPIGVVVPDAPLQRQFDAFEHTGRERVARGPVQEVVDAGFGVVAAGGAA
jgi:hypothetical protein